MGWQASKSSGPPQIPSGTAYEGNAVNQEARECARFDRKYRDGGRMVHLTPMPCHRAGRYGTGIYDVGTEASNFETNQVSQTLGRPNSRSELTSIPHSEMGQPRLPHDRRGPQPVACCNRQKRLGPSESLDLCLQTW